MDNKAYEGRQSYIDFLKDFGFDEILKDNISQNSRSSDESDQPKESFHRRKVIDSPKYVPSKSNSEVVFNTNDEKYLDEKNIDPSTSSKEFHLKRTMGLWSGVSIIVGTMIGSGIFISPKGIVAGSGSVGFSLTIWAVCGFVSFLGSLCMAELATMYTKNGGDYMYLKEGLGNFPAFIYAQVSSVIIRPATIALTSLTCAEYIIIPIFDDACATVPSVIVKLTAVAITILLLIINGKSVVLAARIQMIFTIGKVLAMFIIIVGGMVKLGQGNTQYLETGFEGTENNIGKIAIGFYNGMYAYAGWANLSMIAGEMKNPKRNIPLAMLISVPTVTILYLLVNVSYFSVMSVEDILSSPAVGITWGERVLGSYAWIISVGVALSTFGACNGLCLSAGRLAYSSSREGHTIELFSMVHVKTFTPLPSVGQMIVIAIVFTIPSNVSSLLDMLNFVAYTFVGLVMVSLLVMRVTKKDVERIFKVPIPLPIFMVFVSIFLVFAPFIEEIKDEYLFGIAIIAGFSLLYFPFIYKRYKLPGMSAFTKAVQLFLQVAPPSNKDN